MIGLYDCAVVCFEACDCRVVDMLYETWLRVPFRVGAFILSAEVGVFIGEGCRVEGSWKGVGFIEGWGGGHGSSWARRREHSDGA